MSTRRQISNVRVPRRVISVLAAGSLAASGFVIGAPAAQSASPGAGELADPPFVSTLATVPSDGDAAVALTVVSVNDIGTQFLLGGSFNEYQGAPTQGLALVDRTGRLLDNLELSRSSTTLPADGAYPYFEDIPNYTFDRSVVTAIAPIPGTCTFLIGGVFADATYLKKVSTCGNRLREVEAFRFPQPASSSRDAVVPYYGFNGVIHDIEAIGPRSYLIAGQFNRFSDKRVNGFGLFQLDSDLKTLRQSPGRLTSKLNMNRTYYPSFSGEPFVPTVYSITQDSRGIVYIGGNFTKYDSTPVGGVVALDSFGDIYHNFSGGVGRRPGSSRPDVRTIEVVGLERDRVVVGGAFNAVNGVDGSVENMIQYSPEGNPLPTLLGIEASGSTCFDGPALVRDISRMPDGRYMVVGDMTAIRGTGGRAKQAYGLARLNADLTVDSSWSPSTNAGIYEDQRPCSGIAAASVPNEADNFDIFVLGRFRYYVAASGSSLSTSGAVKLSPGQWPNDGTAERGTFKAKAPVVRVTLPLAYEDKVIVAKAPAEVAFGVEGDLAVDPQERVRLRTIEIGTRGANDAQCVFPPFSESRDVTDFGTNTITYTYQEGSVAALLPWSAGDSLCFRQTISTDRQDYFSPTTQVLMLD